MIFWSGKTHDIFAEGRNDTSQSTEVTKSLKITEIIRKKEKRKRVPYVLPNPNPNPNPNPSPNPNPNSNPNRNPNPNPNPNPKGVHMELLLKERVFGKFPSWPLRSVFNFLKS